MNQVGVNLPGRDQMPFAFCGWASRPSLDVPSYGGRECSTVLLDRGPRVLGRESQIQRIPAINSRRPTSSCAEPVRQPWNSC